MAFGDELHTESGTLQTGRSSPHARVGRTLCGRHDEPEQIAVEAKDMLTRLGVEEFGQTCGQLSGGQRKRLALVAVLLSNADILVLDEPTNHLDSEMNDWLEDVLVNRRGTVVMVTHDRYFLDRVSKRIVELDQGKLYSYDTNYSGFLELKMQREEMAFASERKRLTILRNELAWVQRGARARTTKQKARLERFEELKNTQGPKTKEQVLLSSMGSRLGRTTVELYDLRKIYDGKELLHDFTYLFQKQDRVGFVGRNGSGKSTLMKMIMGLVEPDAGRIEIGQTVKLGYYAQEIDDTLMNPNQRVIDYIKDVAEFVETPEGKVSAARMLENFLFAGEDQYGLLGKLSGGERRRLYLCKVLMGAPNVLLLDEPTNDLDIATLQVLEDYLDNFEGIVIVVSHDRYFLDRTVNRIFEMEPGQSPKQYEGGYTDYYLKKKAALEAEGLGDSSAVSKDGGKSPSCGDAPQEEKTESSGKNWKSGQKKKLKFSYQEQKDYETIEDTIASLEEKLEELEKEYLNCGSDFVKLNKITEEKEKTQALLDEKMDRWMYLEDLAARIEKGEMVD